jgi:hypothetical protein
LLNATSLATFWHYQRSGLKSGYQLDITTILVGERGADQGQLSLVFTFSIKPSMSSEIIKKARLSRRSVHIFAGAIIPKHSTLKGFFTHVLYLLASIFRLVISLSKFFPRGESFSGGQMDCSSSFL